MGNLLWSDGYRELPRQLSVERYGLSRRSSDPDRDRRLAALCERLLGFLGFDGVAVTVLDGAKQVYIAAAGDVPFDSVDRSASLCERVMKLNQGRLFATPDASAEPDLAGSELIHSVGIRRYLTAPLIGREDLLLGTVCAWSSEPGPIGDDQTAQLAATAEHVMRLLDRLRDARETVPEASAPDLAAPGAPPGEARGTADRVRSRAGTGENAWTIDAVIDDRAVRTLFQPVVHLDTGTVVGFEALSRGPAGSELESPAAMIAAARSVGRLGELDWLCRVHSMQAAGDNDLPGGLSWLINVEPAGLAIECPEFLRPSLARARSGLRVVLEVVERDVEGYVTHLLHACDQARRDAWGVALDDVGAEQSSLALLPFLQPDVVKLDMSLVRSVPAESAASITAAVRAYAERTGAVILAEGIETVEQERLARVFGATFGQGYRYGKPGPLPEYLPEPREVIPLRQHPEPLTGATPFETLAELVEPQRADQQTLQHIAEHLEYEASRQDGGCVVLACLQDGGLITPGHRLVFDEFARTKALTVLLADQLPSETRPRYVARSPLPGSRIAAEWMTIVCSPHYTAAFVARRAGRNPETGSDSYDFVYTHNPTGVVAAGRSFLQELLPDVPGVLGGAPREGASATVRNSAESGHPEQDRGARRRSIGWRRARQ